MGNKIINNKGVATVITTNTNAISIDASTRLNSKLSRVYNKATQLNKMLADNRLHIDNRPFDIGVPYKKHTISKDIDGSVYISRNDILSAPDYMVNDPTNWVPLTRVRKPKCIMKNTYNNGNHKYITNGMYTPSELSDMLRTNDYYGYIQNNDWIEIETLNYKFKMIANIDIYNADINDIVHNIDFICIRADVKNYQGKFVNPWNGEELVDMDITRNVRIPDTTMPISLAQYACDGWFNYVPAFLDNHNIGFGNEFSSHIHPKIKSVPYRNINKNDLKDSINMGFDKSIIENFNMGKVWFISETEIFGINILSSTLDSMCSTQYPMFEKVHYRKFNLNGTYMQSMLSSLKDSKDIRPLYVTPNNRVTSSNDNINSHPIFGMRFY